MDILSIMLSMVAVLNHYTLTLIWPARPAMHACSLDWTKMATVTAAGSVPIYVFKAVAAALYCYNSRQSDVLVMKICPQWLLHLSVRGISSMHCNIQGCKVVRVCHKRLVSQKLSCTLYIILPGSDLVQDSKAKAYSHFVHIIQIYQAASVAIAIYTEHTA